MHHWPTKPLRDPIPILEHRASRLRDLFLLLEFGFDLAVLEDFDHFEPFNRHHLDTMFFAMLTDIGNVLCHRVC